MMLGVKPDWVISHMMVWWARLELKVLGLSVQMDGIEKIPTHGPFILMANHQSLLDVFVYASFFDRPVFYILKKEFGRIPFLGWVLRQSDQIFLDRENHENAIVNLNRGVAKLQEGKCTVIFPEGTRRPHGTLGAFKKGAFHLALQSRVPVIPVAMLNSGALLPSREFLSLRPGVIRLVVCDPIDTTGWSAETLDQHLDEVRQSIAGPLGLAGVSESPDVSFRSPRKRTHVMHIRLGYEFVFDCPQPTPMIVMTNVHYSRVSDLLTPDHVKTNPSVPIRAYRDSFGNWCNRVISPAGTFTISADAMLNDSGVPDAFVPDAQQHPVQDLPDDTLLYLMGSRYCETDRLTPTIWNLFDNAAKGWARVQAICDFVHQHIEFGYQYARSTKSALEVFQEKKGVCRDFAHLAIACCRAMNIPARYCTGYLSDIGQPPPYAPMDFAAWFEAYLGGNWYVFDPRNNQRRIGRILIARGRDAADVPITNTFGPTTLRSFRVWTDEAAPTQDPLDKTAARR
jgi:1-acyl-sn-glycerol-3-phosphate acyltransferase